MRINPRYVFIATCLLGTVAYGLVNSGGAVYKFEKGQKLKYVTTVISETDGGGGFIETKTETVTEYTVLDVSEDGVRMRSKVLSEKTDSEVEHEMHSREGFTQEFLVSTLGMGSQFKIIDAADAHVAEDDEVAKLVEPLFGLVLPGTDLVEGMTWDVTHTMKGGDSKMTVTYKVEGFETVDGIKLAVITSKGSGKGSATLRSSQGDIQADRRVKETAKYYFDIARGLVITAEKTAEISIFSDFGEFYSTRKTKQKLSD